jgi:SAM-dependent methyltransferase
MSKAAEQAYLEKIGPDGRLHSKEKPFSNPDCGTTLASIGAVFNLLPPPPGRLLDLGCGGGWTSVFFAKHGYEVVGQDIARDMIVLAEENAARAPGTRLSFIESDYESLGFRDEFDCAVFFDCLHHAVDELAALRSAFDALKPGGVLITHEPGEGHSTTPASLDAMRLYGVTERDMPPSLIIRRGREVGFDRADIFPMQHDLNAVFYRRERPPLISQAGLQRLRWLLKLAFGRDARNGAIVRLVKPAAPSS